MFSVWLMFGAVAADNEDAAEEITVWGDRFARWERRWYVETEVHFATPQPLLGWVNTEMAVTHLQVRAVLSCDKDFELGQHTWEVSCAVEDIGLVAMPRIVSASDQRLLDETDETLTDASIQLQVSDVGKVPNVDLEGVDANDLRTRTRQEHLRQIMSQVILPFHLALPDTVVDGAKWYEYDSRLLSMASTTASAGATEMAHFLNAVSPDYFVVQSIGHGTGRPRPDSQVMTSNGVIDLVDVWELDMTGVALVERQSGIMSERVWMVGGRLMASSPNALSPVRYYHAGRIRLLDETEHPNVGPTVVTARATGKGRNQVHPGELDRAAWVPLPP